MRNSEEILDDMNATPREREIIAEAIRRSRAEAAWHADKARNPNLPRQARYTGPKASDVLDEIPMDDPERWAALCEAFRVRVKEASQEEDSES